MDARVQECCWLTSVTALRKGKEGSKYLEQQQPPLPRPQAGRLVALLSRSQKAPGLTSPAAAL